MAQEHFSGWAGNDAFILSRMTDGKNAKLKVSLPDGKESKFRGILPDRASHSGYVEVEGNQMVYQKYGDLYLLSPDGSERQLTNDTLLERNPTPSPDGSKIAYTREHDLYVYDFTKDEELQLTTDGSETIYNGWSSWVYYEEIHGRSSHYRAFWWSPNSDYIAFLQFDDSPVPTFPIFHTKGQHGSLEWMRYPKAGDPPPSVRLGMVHSSGKSIIWAEEDPLKDQYTAWPFWTPDGKSLLFQELNRDQDSLRIVLTNPIDGKSRTIYFESHSTWVSFFEEMHFINNTEFLIRSHRDGWLNLYLCNIGGDEPRQLTSDPWSIQEVSRVDTESNLLYYYASGPVNTDRHFFRLDLQNHQVTQLTSEPGWHSVNLSPDGSYLHDKYSTLHQPASEHIKEVKTGNVVYRLDKSDHNANQLSGVEIRQFQIETDDGFTLPGYMVLPKGFDEGETYPVVFTVYGGPDRREVRNRYRDFSRDFYANNGIIQVKLDHRGSGRFGREGMDYLHRSLGKWEIEDLIAGVKWLHDQPYIADDQIGITGGSYGGYLTCMALTYGAEYFSHGVSLYPVVDWQLYDNVYTERFMDQPADNPNGYMAGSALTHAHRYKGDLLIIHGGVDDNVHAQNTMQFISLMQDLGKQFEMMIYPGERHGWGGAKRSHLSRLTNQFWKEKFGIGEATQVLRP